MKPKELKMPDPSPEPAKTLPQREYDIQGALLSKIESCVSLGAFDTAGEWISSYKTFMEAINQT